jgi:hypothetical protein
VSKIYVASSWRNERQPAIVVALRAAGHEVYDFRHPRKDDHGFSWGNIAEAWQSWSMEEYRDALQNEIAISGFNLDMAAMEWADTFVGVQPFGRSASMEMGWAAGRDKRTILLLENGEPELMVKMFDRICISLDEVLSILGTAAAPSGAGDEEEGR